MLKLIILSLSLLSTINSAFGSEELEKKVLIDLDGKFKLVSLTLGQDLPFLKFNAEKKIITGAIYAGCYGEIHEITEDPTSWILTRKLFDAFNELEISIFRVHFNEHKK